MNYCPHCGHKLTGYRYPYNPCTPYTPYPTYHYWFSTAGSGGGGDITYQNKGDPNGTQRSPKN